MSRTIADAVAEVLLAAVTYHWTHWCPTWPGACTCHEDEDVDDT